MRDVDYQAKRYVPVTVTDKRRSVPPAKSWMQRLPDELPHEHVRRLHHTCYHCGQYEENMQDLDKHEESHLERG